MLPCAGQLERADVTPLDHILALNAAQYTSAVVSPAADRKPVWWALAQLGRRLGVDVLPGDLDPDTCSDDDLLEVLLADVPLDRQLAPEGGAFFDELRRHPSGIVSSAAPPPGWVHEKLPVGGWQLAPEPLVAQLASFASVSSSELSLVPRRQLGNLNSQLADGTGAVKLRAERPELLLNPDDAAKAGVSDGEMVRVESDYGSVVAVTRLTTRILRGVVSLPHGYRDCNVGDLTSDRDHVDPLTGMVLQSGVTVRLVAVGSGTERPARV